MLKIRLEVSDDKKENIQQLLAQGQVIFDSEDSEFMLSEIDLSIREIICKKGGVIYTVSLEDIVYLESVDHEIFIKTSKEEFNIRHTLSFYEYNLPEHFIRVHKSYIVNRNKISCINPMIGMQFVLIMANQDKLRVSRSYYYQFKEKIGF